MIERENDPFTGILNGLALAIVLFTFIAIVITIIAAIV
jgi:hypothetical protein